MKSKAFVTYEVDDPKLAALELKQQFEQGLPLMKDSVGLVFCYSDMEVAELAKELHRQIPIPILGGTAIASMDRDRGFHELAVTLMVLTADDCNFAVTVSEPITCQGPGLAHSGEGLAHGGERESAAVPRLAAYPDIHGQVAGAYQSALAALPDTPALVYALFPYQANMMLDNYADIFTDIAPGVPVIGGLPSYNGTGDNNFTIYNGEVFRDRLVMLAISGNLRPLFSVQTVLEASGIKKCRVTEAKDNVIYQVDGRPFTDYLTDIGMPLSAMAGTRQLISFVANPLLVQDTRAEFGPEFKYLRALQDINMDKGSGTVIGRVPEGSFVAVHPLDRHEIGVAARRGIRDLKEQMGRMERMGQIAAPTAPQTAAGYTYHTILAISCIGRYVVMMPNGEVETDNILDELPDGLELAGFYSYGEVSPLPVPGGAVTFAHNESLVLCAF